MHVRNKPPATRQMQKREVFPREDAKTTAVEGKAIIAMVPHVP
jgi:hypothetical protein